MPRILELPATGPKIARNLGERTIHPALLDRVNEGMGEDGQRFESVAELLLRLDARLSRKLLEELLPSFTILDPACGSGAFLVAALETLTEIYRAVAARVEPVLSPGEIRRRILRDNLFGVDLSPKAAEATRLRLLLAPEELEPLPPPDLNLFCGNSLLGLLHVDDGDFERRQPGLFRRSFRQVLDEKGLGSDRERRDAVSTLDLILLDEWKDIPYKPVKRPVSIEDVAALRPFHWAYELDPVLEERGGFDVILSHPPWETVKPGQTDLAHLCQYYRASPQYNHPIAATEGRKGGADLHLHELFLARSFRLLRPGGRCGIVLPTSFYDDPAAKALRETLFSEARVEALVGLSNARSLFPGVDPDFRLCLLVFQRGGATESFTAAFRIEPKDAVSADRLEEFLGGEHLRWSWDLVKRLSPGSFVLPEDRRQIDLDLLAKAFRFPALGSEVAESWTLRLAKEFDSTNDSYLFRTAPAPHRLPLYEGRMIGPFTADAGAPRYWLEEEEARRALLGRKADTGQHLEYQGYRLGFRDGARDSGEGPLVLAILPPGVFSNDKLPTALLRSAGGSDLPSSLFLCAVLNSSVAGYLLRQRAAASVTFSILSQLPVPRPQPGTSAFSSLVELAARLTCTTPDFAGLWQGAIGTFWFAEEAAVDPAERQRLSAEIDGRVAHLYGLTEGELAHVLTTRPGGDREGQEAALVAYGVLG
jgi:hypothetical protein